MESIGRRVRDARQRSLSERIEQCGRTAAEEEAAVLLPTRREGLLLTLFWGALIAGIFLCYGMTWRSICGAIFAVALLWLSFLDLRDGMLYDCITLPFALLGAFFSIGFLRRLRAASSAAYSAEAFSMHCTSFHAAASAVGM